MRSKCHAATKLLAVLAVASRGFAAEGIGFLNFEEAVLATAELQQGRAMLDEKHRDRWAAR